jgi:hypothetical protein
MPCTQQKQLRSYPKVRIHKKWFRHFNDTKDFHNEGTLHLFSLMALFSYANFRSNTRTLDSGSYIEAPGEWICKLSALPRILRAHSKAHALEILDYFRDAGFLDYEWLDEASELLRYRLSDWKRHCVHLDYNYYSYKGSGFFFFPLPVGRLLLARSRNSGKIVFSELDAIMDLWLHTILNDASVRGSEYMPVVYFDNMKGQPLLSYSYLAKRWGWSKSRVGRFILKAEAHGVISRVSFSSSRGTVISPCCYREMIYGDDCEQLSLQLIGALLGILSVVEPNDDTDAVEVKVQTRVPSEPMVQTAVKSLRIQVFRESGSSFFARPTPLIFYSSLVWGKLSIEDGTYRGPPVKFIKPGKESRDGRKK